ncbi:kinase-like domain-containing protein [Cyathus striatus]|nr:kinase-like domain-containing protein [Cyathus striatus]
MSSKRELLEAFRACDENGFLYLTVAWKEGDAFYIGKHYENVVTVNEEELSELQGSSVPRDHIQAPWSTTYTEAPNPLPEDVYIKNPIGISFYEGTPVLPKLVSSEITIFENILKNPHRNVCTYYGCIRDGDYVGGVVLEKYRRTLENLMDSNPIIGSNIETQTTPFNPEAILTGIRQGLDHIHSLGLVHDDINPRNIMIDDDGEPVIIDFNSCMLPGELSRGGTPGWSNCPNIATFENDEFGFDLICKMVWGEYDGSDVSAHGL